MLEHADWIRRFAARLISDGNEAEDVMQESLMQAQSLSAPAGVAQQAWIFGIVKNVAHSRRRREQRLHNRERKQAKPEHSVPSALDDAAMMERQRELLTHIESLPEAQRRAIIARFYDGLAPRKIAAAEKTSVSTINSRIQRGIASLRSQLDAKFGDRRTWAAWFAPMVKVNAKGPLSAGLLVTLGIAALVGGGFALRSAFTRKTAPAPLVSSNQAHLPAKLVAAPAGKPALQEPDSALRHAPGVRPPTPNAASVKISVINSKLGAPVPLAKVWAAPLSVLQDDPDLWFAAVEQVLRSKGLHLHTDEEGLVILNMETPFLAIASNERELGFVGVQAGARAATLQLSPTRRLAVHVVNGEGEPVLDGVRIAAHALSSKNKDLSDDLVSSQVRELIDGVAYFQNPWLGMDIDGELVGPEHPYTFSIEAMHIDAPGFAEFEPASSSPKPFYPFRDGPMEKERTFVLPESGSLQVEIRDREGMIVPFDGTASLQFPGKSYGAKVAWSKSYTATIVAGVANWPRFAIGARRFRVALNLPERGAKWTMEGNGPHRAGETKTIRAVLSNRPAIQARLLDQEGKPIQLDNIALNYGHPSGKGRSIRSSIRASSTADGSLRFELPEGEQLAPPYALCLYRSEGWPQAQQALALIELSPRDIQFGHDLGDVSLSFLDPVSIKGRVTTESGEPVPDVPIVLERLGLVPLQVPTDAEGRYECTWVVHEGSTISVKTRGLGFMPQTRSISASDADKPQDFTLFRGATFRAQIDMGDLKASDSTVNLIFRGPHPDDITAVPHLGSGLFEVSHLKPGEYTSQLRLQGGHVIAGGSGLRVPASGEYTDPRIQGLRLSDHLRSVQVTWEGVENKRRIPQMRVNPIPAQENSFILFNLPGEPFLLPKHIPASATFTVGGRASIRIEDIATIADRLHLVFELPFVATLFIQGTPDPAFNYSLVGESGTKASGSWIGLPDAALNSGKAQVQVPAPGVYRLYRGQKPITKANAQGIVEAEAPQPTALTLEIRQAPEPGKPFTANLAIEAALLK